MRKVMLAGALPALLTSIIFASSISGPPGDQFDRSLLRMRPEGLSAAGDTSIAITVDKSSFPLVRVYADVFDESDMPIPGLGHDDFTVAQNGEPVDFQLRQVSDFGCPTSICLVIDVSLSMEGQPIEAARQAAHQFVDRMGPYDRAAIVTFADCVDINAPFTDDRDALHAAINNLEPVGLTASFDGIYQGVMLASEQPGDRAVIAFSDGCDNNSGSCSLPPDGWADGYEDDSTLVCDMANGVAVSIYTLTFGPLESTCLDPMEAFATGTGGNYRHSPDAGAIDSVYTEIQEAVCSRYFIVYESPDAVADFSEHNVTICLANTDSPCCDTMSYLEPMAPVIIRTAETIALSDTCRPPQSDVTIAAVVTDVAAPFIQSVQLLYREVSAEEGTFSALPMTHIGGDVYSVTVPGSTWTAVTVGLEYFVSASDGDATVTLPALDPYQNPFVVSFCPNGPPEILDVEVDCGQGETVSVRAVIRDTLDDVDHVTAYYRPAGAILYDSTELVSGAYSEMDFQGSLLSVLPSRAYELVVKAWDNAGLSSAVGPWVFRCDSVPPDTVVPSDRWITLTCMGPLLAGQVLSPGDVVRAYDYWDGGLCGKAIVGADSAFEELLVYGDDPATPLIDEGPEIGDPIAVSINGGSWIWWDRMISWTGHGDTYEVCELLPCQHFELEAGWHLISWNRQFSAGVDSLAALLGESCVDIILTFDRGALAYDPDLPQYSTLETVNYYRGYWVKLECPTEFTLCADPIAETDEIQLYRGWNLVGYWPADSLPIEDAWSSLLEAATVGLGFDDGGLIWKPEEPLYNTLVDLTPGLGYWVRMSESRYLRYPGWIGSEQSGPLANEIPRNSRLAPSQQWISVFGSNITVDENPVANDAVFEVFSTAGVLCGEGTYSTRRLLFTPVYGAAGDIENAAYPQAGDSLIVAVNGVPVYPRLAWTGHGNRIELHALSTSPIANAAQVPATYALAQNYPNPFNPQTTIAFELPQPGRVTLRVYNILGREVATLVDQWYPAGTHTVRWNGTDGSGQGVGSGMYLYRLETDRGAISRKMLLLK